MALPGDARLAARVRRGDDKAFEQLYARHQPAILSFCRHLTGSREDAEDAVQHAFLAAYRRIFEADDDLELRPWLFTVARNRCLSLLRARRGGALDAERVETFTDGLAAEVERRQELRDLVVDLGRLPERQRAALVLSQLEALSHREIGAVLGVPSEKVKALVFQARSTLVATRAARAEPCVDVREQLATARGSALRRRTLRHHVRECEGCRTFEASVLRQRQNLEILLPVAPSAGLAQAILGRDGTVVGAGGTAVATAASGGAGGGIAGSLAAIGVPSAAKLAVVAVVAVGGTTGAVAAELPERIHDRVIGNAVAEHAPLDPGGRAGDRGGGSGAVGAPGAGGEKGVGDTGDDRGKAGGDGAPAAESGGVPGAEGASEGAGGEPAPAGDDGHGSGGGPGLPPGLAKKDELPPGLAKKDKLPPGLAEHEASPPGKTKGPSNGNAGGQGQGGGNGNAGGNGNGNAGGNGNRGGEGQGGGQGNGNASGGNGGGQGNGAGNGDPH